MVHNGIEYGLMQAYAEGFEIMHASEYELDLGAIAELWSRAGSCARGCSSCSASRSTPIPGLEGIRGYVEDSGEGRWTVEEAIDTAVPAPVIALSLMLRQRSRQDDSYSAKVNAALRNQFGGHAVKERVSTNPLRDGMRMSRVPGPGRARHLRRAPATSRTAS